MMFIKMDRGGGGGISSSSRVQRRLPLITVTATLVALSLIGCTASRSDAAPSATPQENDKDRGVRHLQVDVVNSTSIVLKWSTPNRSSATCNPQGYTVRLKQTGIRKSLAWRLAGDRQTVTLHDLQPGTEYNLRVMTVTCDGQKKHSRWVKVTTLPAESQQEETQAPGQPTSVRVRTTADSAVVSWSPPEDNTLVRTYMIGYGEGVPDVKWIYVNGTQRNVTIQNLKPSTQYVISVRAINSLGKGLVIYDLVYTKDIAQTRFSAGGSLPAPVHLTSKIISPTSVLLQWVDQSLDSQQRITDERYYNVYYQATPSGKNLSVIVKALHVTLADLQPNRQYRFKVRTVKGSLTSPFSDSITNWTRMDSTSVDDVSGHFPIPQPTPRHSGGGSVVDDYDDYDADDGNIDILQPSSRSGGEQGKTKRAHHSRPPLGSPPQLAMARTLIDPIQQVNNNATATSGSDTAPSSSNTIQIQFRSLVQYRISAYVTWPDKPVACAEGASASSGNVAGYIFRYKALDDDVKGSSGVNSVNEFIVRNLVANFVLLDNLMPRVKYVYQVRYVFDRGEPSAWSQEALLDTTYNPTRS